MGTSKKKKELLRFGNKWLTHESVYWSEPFFFMYSWVGRCLRTLIVTSRLCMHGSPFLWPLIALLLCCTGSHCLPCPIPVPFLTNVRTRTHTLSDLNMHDISQVSYSL